MTQPKIVKQAVIAHKQKILAKPNVVGLGVGYKKVAGRMTDELSVVVMVRDKKPPAGLLGEEKVPKIVNGIKTDVIQVGEIKALQKLNERWRPAPGGVSIGHYQTSAGTFGCVVNDRESGELMILSNNHVLANSNNAQIGDPILQPGPADGGIIEEDIIAFLERFIPIQFTASPSSCSVANAYVSFGNKIAQFVGSNHRLLALQSNPLASNQVDAAVAKPLDVEMIQAEILEIGEIIGITPAVLGKLVRKTGRTSGFRTGEITVLHATVNVSYGQAGSATFDDQIITSPMSVGGDSGSLLVAGDSLHAVGLLFGGSNQATVFNPIDRVLDQLNVEFKSKSGAEQKAGIKNSVDKVQAIKQAYEEQLMSKANVVGVGIGLRRKGGVRTDEVALQVLVTQKVPPANLAPSDLIPSEIEGVPVDVKVVGHLEAQ